MSYLAFYLVFGAVFVAGVVGYWLVTRVLRNPGEIYVPEAAA